MTPGTQGLISRLAVPLTIVLLGLLAGIAAMLGVALSLERAEVAALQERADKDWDTTKGRFLKGDSVDARKEIILGEKRNFCPLNSSDETGHAQSIATASNECEPCDVRWAYSDLRFSADAPPVGVKFKNLADIANLPAGTNLEFWVPESTLCNDTEVLAAGRLFEVDGEKYIFAYLIDPRTDRANTLRAAIPFWIIVFLLACGAIVYSQEKAARRQLAALNSVLSEAGQGHLEARIEEPERLGAYSDVAKSINQTIARLQNLTESLRNILDQVAHDFQAPLDRALFRLQSTPAGSAETMARLAVEQLGSLKAEMRAFLDLREIEFGVGSQLTWINPSDVLNDIVVYYEDRLEDDGQFEFFAEGSDYQCLGDPVLLVRAVSNVMENAIKFASLEGVPQIRLSIVVEGSECVIAVDDNGPGWPPGLTDALMVRRSDAAKGHGLGLLSVKAVMQRFGGELRLGSSELGGARAEMRLKAVQVQS